MTRYFSFGHTDTDIEKRTSRRHSAVISAVGQDEPGALLDRLGQYADWEAYESEQSSVLLRVYDLKVRRVRIDSSTVKGTVTVTEDSLFPFGHSKEHRPDLPQLKINQSALDPLGMPLARRSSAATVPTILVCAGNTQSSSRHSLIPLKITI